MQLSSLEICKQHCELRPLRKRRRRAGPLVEDDHAILCATDKHQLGQLVDAPLEAPAGALTVRGRRRYTPNTNCGCRGCRSLSQMTREKSSLRSIFASSAELRSRPQFRAGRDDASLAHSFYWRPGWPPPRKASLLFQIEAASSKAAVSHSSRGTMKNTSNSLPSGSLGVQAQAVAVVGLAGQGAGGQQRLARLARSWIGRHLPGRVVQADAVARRGRRRLCRRQTGRGRGGCRCRWRA